MHLNVIFGLCICACHSVWGSRDAILYVWITVGTGGAWYFILLLLSSNQWNVPAIFNVLFLPFVRLFGASFPQPHLVFSEFVSPPSNLSVFSTGYCVHLGSSRDETDFGHLHKDLVQDTDDLWECWKYTLAREEKDKHKYGGITCYHSPLSLFTTTLDTVGLETRSTVGKSLLSMHTHWAHFDYIGTLANWTKHRESLFKK